jgi:dihydrofolate reductase
MIVSLIAAVSDNGVIGLDGAIPWHLPADLKLFKQLTMGHYLIVGRRTYQSIGRPLPGRKMLVLSRQPDFSAEGCFTATFFPSFDMQSWQVIKRQYYPSRLGQEHSFTTEVLHRIIE